MINADDAHFTCQNCYGVMIEVKKREGETKNHRNSNVNATKPNSFTYKVYITSSAKTNQSPV